VVAEVPQDGFEGEEVLRPVIDEQDIDLGGKRHPILSPGWEWDYYWLVLPSSTAFMPVAPRSGAA
jgi:hypothetical protein